MRTIALIISCQMDRDNGREDASRQTWVKTWGHLIDHVYIIGKGYKPPVEEDHLVSAVPDDYGHHPLKQHEGYIWAIQEEYDRALICYTDTYVNVPRLLAVPADHYVGKCVEHGPIYASGGCGYLLSRTAMWAILRHRAYPGYGDLQDGDSLEREGFHLTVNSGFDADITHHLGRGTGVFDPLWMREHHALTLAGML
jgi:hypothetical protein